MATVPGIELIDVHATLGGERVLRGVSFGVPAGGVTALLGPSGAGKTTCLRAIVGLLAPDEGDVLVEGRSTLSLRKAQRLALSRRFGVMLQGAGVYGSALWDSLTVEENVLHQLRTQRPDLGDEALRARCAERLHEVGLSQRGELMPSQLSAGMRRRLALARALVADPDFAVLDSPELGLDPVRVTRLIDVIDARHGVTGATYLIATHSIPLARKLADEVVVIGDGRVLAEGPAELVLDAHDEDVRELVARMDAAARRPAGGAVQPAEQGFDIPIPLAAAGLLVVITASALWLGGAHPVELAIVAAFWVLAGGLLAVRRQRAADAGHAGRHRRE